MTTDKATATAEKATRNNKAKVESAPTSNNNNSTADLSVEKKRRGRPPKDPAAHAAKVVRQKVPGRGRGRPRIERTPEEERELLAKKALKKAELKAAKGDGDSEGKKFHLLIHHHFCDRVIVF